MVTGPHAGDPQCTQHLADVMTHAANLCGVAGDRRISDVLRVFLGLPPGLSNFYSATKAGTLGYSAPLPLP